MREKCCCGGEIEITSAFYDSDEMKAWRTRHERCLSLNQSLVRASARSMRES